MSPYFQRLAFEGVSFGHLPGKELWKQVNFEFPLNHSVWLRARLGAGAREREHPDGTRATQP